MGKQTKKKKSTGAAKEIFAKAPGRLGKWNVIAFAVLVVGELIYYYAARRRSIYRAENFGYGWRSQLD